MARHAHTTARPGPPLWPIAAGAVVVVAAAGGLYLGATSSTGTDSLTTAAATSAAPTTTTPAASPSPESEPVSFTLVTAGDVLPHTTVNKDAQLADGTWDYVPEMEPMRAYIEGADIALCHLEVPFAPEGEAITAYPVFGAPADLATSLKAIGWDGCSNASNHSLDKGREGLEYTIDVLDAAGLGHAGTGSTAAEAAAAQLYEVSRDGQSFVLAQISATTFHNDYTDPTQWSDVLSPLTDSASIIASAKAARAAGADIVVFTPQWGQEYWKEPDVLQQQLASEIAASGEVDVILGGHPHVPQPMVKLDGGPDGEGMWVAYSQGNFLSNQDEACCDISTSTGLIMEATIEVDGDDARVTNVTWSGSTVDTAGMQRVYPIQSLLDGAQPELLTLSADRIQSRWESLVAIMGTDQYDPAAPPQTGGATVTVLPKEY